MVADQEFIVTLAQLLREEMSLAEDQVVIYNQKWSIPPDERPYIVISYVTGLPYANSKTYDGSNEDGPLIEVQTQNCQEVYSISLYSFGPAARLLKPQILFAMNSDRALRFQELYQFKIANLPTAFLDVSQVEATERLNRYDISFTVLTSYERRRATEYFENFQQSTILINQ